MATLWTVTVPCCVGGVVVERGCDDDQIGDIATAPTCFRSRSGDLVGGDGHVGGGEHHRSGQPGLTTGGGAVGFVGDEPTARPGGYLRHLQHGDAAAVADRVTDKGLQQSLSVLA